MVNRLVESNNNLPQLDYSNLLDEILRAIAEQNSQDLFKFSNNQQWLTIRTHIIAHKVADSLKQPPFLGQQINSRSASVNFSAEFQQKFPNKIRQLKNILQEKLAQFLGNYNLDIDKILENFITNLASLQHSNAELSLTYPFNKTYDLSKQKLKIHRDNKGSQSTLKFHKLTITINDTHRYEEILTQGLTNFFDHYQDNYKGEWDDIEELLQDIEKKSLDKKTDYYRLKKLIDTEFLGQLKRQASINYLEYIAENINTQKYPNIYYLHDLIRRLKLVNEYINDPNQSDDDYIFYYKGVEVDLRLLLSRAEAFDCLPIIPIVGGYLGETTHKTQGKKQFIFGLKLKLNGDVKKEQGNKSSFQYHLNLINPESEQHKKELQISSTKSNFIQKVFKIFALYYIVLSSRLEPDKDDYHPSQELDYNPIENFKSKVLGVLKGNDELAKTNLLVNFFKALSNEKTLKLKIDTKIDSLMRLLKEFIKHGTILPPKDYTFHLGINRGILEQDGEQIVASQTLFKEVIRSNPKKALQYICIVKPTLNHDMIAQFPVNISIEDIRYDTTSTQQTLTISHDISSVQTLPIFFTSIGEQVQNLFKNNQNIKQRKLIFFTFENKSKEDWVSLDYFNYYCSLFLLQYLTCKIILEKADEKLFVPIVRFHTSKRSGKSQEDPEKDIDKNIGDFSKSLAHLLNQDYVSNAQGFDISKVNSYKSFNALTSLYSVMRKRFKFHNPEDIPNLDKLAIITVSSRECDAKTTKQEEDPRQRIGNLLAEVVTFNRQEDGTIIVTTEHSFGDNYPMTRMYNNPTIIADRVTHLYFKGYRHFLYVAKAPYTSTLNITDEDTEEDEGLYFHSQQLVTQLCKNNSEIKLYPIFFDKYFVRKIESNLGERSFYLQNSEELTDIVNDPTQKMVVFFNLFNGVQLANESFYNGVISYATLLEKYERGVFDQQHILQNLIYETATKQDILQYLALFHFYRFEKPKNIQFKLDPYENIIGDESLAKKAIFKHQNGRTNFNVLAFLTEVAKVLRGLDE